MKSALALMLAIVLVVQAEASEFDVYNLYPTDAGIGGVTSDTAWGQAFQMGKAGSLDAIIVSISTNNFAESLATLKLYELTGSEISGTPITSIASSTATLTLGSSALTNYTFEFDNLFFPAGKKLAFGLYGYQISLGLRGSGPANSKPVYIIGGEVFFPVRHASFATLITPVPEPSSAALLLVGAVAVSRRRST